LRDFLFDWQTLIGSTLAILAALLAGWYLQKQMRQAERQAEARREKKFMAARANLPLALSLISNYAFECARVLNTLLANMDGQHPRRNSEILAFPAPPAEAISNLTATVEYTGNRAISEAVSDLLGEIQVANAHFQRIQGQHTEDGLQQGNLDELIMDVADIYARTDDMSGFARRESETIPSRPALGTVQTAINLLQVSQPTAARVKPKIIRRIAQRELALNPKSYFARESLEAWMKTERDAVMDQFEVSADKERFRFRNHLYDHVLDAILYSALLKSRASTLT
jgi:hypothetical protein